MTGASKHKFCHHMILQMKTMHKVGPPKEDGRAERHSHKNERNQVRDTDDAGPTIREKETNHKNT